MNKKLISWVGLILLSFMMQSCKNYYYLKHTPAVDNEDRNPVYDLKFGKESMQFTTFADYQVNMINKKYIFFATKDVNQVLKTNFSKPFTEQFMFMYTKMSIYNNLLGFYYEGASLEEVKQAYGRNPDADMGNGVLYAYDSGKFHVVDIYRKTDNGVVRFVNMSNPDEKDSPNKKFHLEIRNLFFGLNIQLWEKNADGF